VSSDPDTVAVITDIHANLPALQAALARIEELGIESVYCGGDLVGYGPHPNEVCALIAERDIPTIYGNYDYAIARDLEDCGCAYVTQHDRELGQRSVDWTLANTSQASKDFMLGLPFDLNHRASPAHLFSEVIATSGLLLVIFSLARTKRAHIAPAAVGAYIGAAYFFTSSASFANPAISVGRMFSNTFAGIAPASVPGYVVAQFVGCVCAILAIGVLYPDLTADEAADAVMPHHDGHTDADAARAAIDERTQPSAPAG